MRMSAYVLVKNTIKILLGNQKPSKPRKLIDNLNNRLGNRTGNAEILRIGTWNIRTLYKPGSLQYVLKEISRYNVDIMGLQEIKWPGSGNLKSRNMTVFFSGKNNGKHENGIDFIIKTSLSKLVKKFEPINDRIRYTVLTGRIFDTVIINCYASTGTADCELKDQFYDDLDRILENIPRESISTGQTLATTKIKNTVTKNPASTHGFSTMGKKG
jgi:exonuclease III